MRERHEKLTADDKGFLVGKRKLTPCTKRHVTGFETGCSDKRVDDDVCPVHKGKVTDGCAAEGDLGTHLTHLRDSRVFAPRLVADGNLATTELPACRQCHITGCVDGHAHKLEFIVMLAYDIERLDADRTTRAK